MRMSCLTGFRQSFGVHEGYHKNLSAIRIGHHSGQQSAIVEFREKFIAVLNRMLLGDVRASRYVTQL